MEASSRRALVLLVGALWTLGCAKGSGEGQAAGPVWAPDCGLQGELYELNPSFFAMQPSTSVEIIDIVVQRGSDLKSYSDGISIFIREPEMLKESMLGTEIELGGLEAPVEMTLYLNATCPGIARLPVVYGAVSGTIQFDSLFVPWIDNDDQLSAAAFRDVVFVDNEEPDERRATMSGDFRFLFEAGRPPQLF